MSHDPRRPDAIPPAIDVVGAGRAGSSLALAWHRAGARVRVWTRRATSVAELTALGLPSVHTGDVWAFLASSCLSTGGTLVLAVPDDVLGALSRITARSVSIPGHPHPPPLAMHLSGASALDVLEPLRSAGCLTGSLHPVSSIAARGQSVQGVSMAAAGSDAAALQRLEEWGRLAGGRVFAPTGDRALYHAACVLAGNLPQVLLAASMELWERCGIDPETARIALGGLLVGASERAWALGPSAALTGPVVRGDASTVRAHLLAFQAAGVDSDVDSLYRAGSLRAAQLAPRLGDRARAALLAVLTDPAVDRSDAPTTTGPLPAAGEETDADPKNRPPPGNKTAAPDVVSRTGRLR